MTTYERLTVIDLADGKNVHPTKLGELVRSAQERIAASGSESPRLDAEVLLRHVLRTDRVGLFMRLDEAAPDHVAEGFRALVDRRIEGQPIAYLTGVREFMGLAFHVTPEVLIPRPETELLVEWALDWLGQRSDLVIVDVGTGSGAIGICIAAMGTSEANQVIGSDISTDALRVAEGNAERLLTPFRLPTISFASGSLLSWRQEPVDLVLANLPYLTPGQIAANHDLTAEPRLALDGGPDGLDLVRSLIADLPRVLALNGAVGLEVDPDQVDAVIELLTAAFDDATIDVISDLAGHRRHVVIRR